jgi:hydroxymethylbilane synthase
LRLRVGTRGSRLSLAQTDLVIERLQRNYPKLTFEKTVIATKGDLDKHTPLYRLDQKGIFEKEVNQAVLDGNVDFAVHSMKDLPGYEKDTGLVIAGVPERGSPADVLVSQGDRTLEELRPGSVVGTSSLLRIAQLRRARPDLKTEPIRGNVETRILKVEKGEYDAVVLAEAGLERLGLKSKITQRLPLADFLPAPGQGILSPVTKRSSAKVIELLNGVEHSPTRAEGEAERELVRILEGGCKVPIGALALAAGGKLQLTGCVLSVDGKTKLEASRSGEAGNPVSLGREVGDDLIRQGAKGLEEGWRELLE